MNGYIFSFLSKEGDMGLRLSKSDREEFIEKFNTNLIEQHGRIMKEFVQVPLSVLSDTETINNYLRKSFNYVASLKPKKTKKKKLLN